MKKTKQISSVIQKSDVISTEIGNLPRNWPVQRFDAIFAVQQGKQVSKSNRVGENQRPFLRTKNIFWGKIDLSEIDEMHFSEADERRLSLEPGDLLICEGGDIGRTAIWQAELTSCYYQNHLHRARIKDLATADSKFVLYWLWYAFEIGNVYFGRGNVTTIPNLSQSKLCELPLPVPPLQEQQQIAHILGIVQRAIEQQEGIIQKTTELKKALMQKLFTEGLRGEPQKQTEIGPMPETWEVKRLEKISTIIMGQSPDGESYNTEGKGVPLINGPVEFGPNPLSKTLEEKFTIRPTKFCERDDLILCVRGSTTGRTNIAIGRACIGRGVALIRAKGNQDFLNQFIVSIRDRIFSMGAGTTFPNISGSQIKDILVPYPPLREQKEIGDTLSSLDRKFELGQLKHNCLTTLFYALLHYLIGAKIRVNEIDLEGKETLFDD